LIENNEPDRKTNQKTQEHKLLYITGRA